MCRKLLAGGSLPWCLMRNGAAVWLSCSYVHSRKVWLKVIPRYFTFLNQGTEWFNKFTYGLSTSFCKLPLHKWPPKFLHDESELAISGQEFCVIGYRPSLLSDLSGIPFMISVTTWGQEQVTRHQITCMVELWLFLDIWDVRPFCYNLDMKLGVELWRAFSVQESNFSMRP